jgi:glutaminyl-tRNA synthetase
VSIKHAVDAEVRLYDRLFIDEAPIAKEKLLEFKIQILWKL